MTDRPEDRPDDAPEDRPDDAPEGDDPEDALPSEPDQPSTDDEPDGSSAEDDVAALFEGLELEDLDLDDLAGRLGEQPGGGDPSPGDLPAELGGLLDQLGLGGAAGGAQLPPELGSLFEQLGGGGQLPDEIGQMFEQLQTPEGRAELERQAEQLFGEGGPFAAMFGGGGPFAGGMPFGPAGPFGAGAGAPSGPVDWQLATRVALQIAADGDRPATVEETARLTEAVRLAEHWLDDSSLPAPPDGGQVRVTSRQEWVNLAVEAMRPVVDPVARASANAMADLAREQLGQLGGRDLPEELAPLQPLLDQLSAGDVGEMFRPVGAMLSGLQAGQILGQLARTLLGQFDLALPTGPRSQAQLVAVNVAEAFDGWGLDDTEVASVLALHESAMRRLFHAVPWLEAHVHSLVARFAAGTVVDLDRLQDVSRELMAGVDPEDPEALEAAMERAAGFQLEPTEEQRRLLQRLQGVVCLVGAWARHEVARVAEQRIPSLARIAEVQRRRRVERGDGDDLLAALLGLDLQPEDEALGERFVAAVEQVRGPQGLRRTLEHPENLPDAAELADPQAWLARTAEDGDVPDDPSALFGDLDDAPSERSADERLSDPDDDA